MDGRSGGRGAGGRAALAAAAFTLLSVVALTIVAAAAPEGFRSAWGLNRTTADVYRSALGWFPDWRFTSEQGFVWSFRAVLLAAWAGWAALLYAACTRPHQLRGARPAAIAAIVFLVVAAPSIFSTDVFAYVGWSRQMWAQDLNPYLTSDAMTSAASSAGAQRQWPATIPYGPLWALVARWLGALAAPGGLFSEVLVHKALAGAGLLASAAGAARIASFGKPGFGPVAWLAVGFCPLLLVEGPISGHNDFVAIGLLTWAAAVGVTAPNHRSALLLGLAVAWKPTAAGAVPLLLLSLWRTQGLRPATIALLLCAAPSLLLSLPFGGIMPILASVAGRVGGGGEMLNPLRIFLLMAGLVWGVWIVMRARPVSGTTWHEAWVPASLGITLGTSIVLFPWYFAWTLIPALTRWEMRYFPAVSGLCMLAILAMWIYAAPLR